MDKLYVVRKSSLTCNHMGQVKYLPVGVNPADMIAKMAQKIVELTTELTATVTKELLKDTPTPDPVSVATKMFELLKKAIQELPKAFDMPGESPVIWHVEDSAVVTMEDLLERSFIVGCLNVGPGLKPCTKVIQVFPTVLSKLTLVEGVHPEETPVLDLLNEQMISGTMTDSTPPGWLVILPPQIGVNQTSHKESMGMGFP